MAIGTVFTLLILPSIYVLLARDHSHDRLPERIAPPTPAPGLATIATLAK
jgi:hypothetical protein